MRLRPDLWLLDPDVAHLNHGSFGAVPVPVLDAQRRAAHAIERSPERFYRADLAPAIDAVRARVADFLGVEQDSLALVQNATEAVQVALDAVELRPGSEIVITDHAYGWVKAAVRRACVARGAVERLVTLPKVTDGASYTVGASFAEQVTAAVTGALTARTALVVIDQITSASALLMPVDAVIAATAASAAKYGTDVPVLVDGAHAPGLIDSPVPEGASFWLGNLHKWAFAARTAAALVVAPQYRGRVRPMVASAAAAAGYPRSFSYLGTQDPTAYLALPESLAFPDEYLGMSFTRLRERNAELLDRGLERLTSRLGVRPVRPSHLPMRTVDLGVTGDDAAANDWTTRLRAAGVEVAITSVVGDLQARVSVQAYVSLADFERLGEALAALLRVKT
ncbi:MAG TPA: aminotransferase class V-fold PLP-dependent enzyme [Trueperaceae bacterium]|nr:aminotransferase class V-fold PLP-dependent enzyme [Trueperaceae bacterium]